MKYLTILLINLMIRMIFCSSTKKLQFKNREFNILQLTDLHYGGNKFNNLYTTALVNFLITTFKPDFTAVTGDVVTGYEITTSAHEEFQKLWKQFQLPFEIQQQEYGMTLGNHDTETYLNCSQITQLDMLSKYSHSQEMLPTVSPGPNYYLLIYSSIDPTQVVSVLWFFDSHSYGCLQVQEGYGCVEEDQINWFLDSYSTLEKQYGQNMTHLVFFHIPFQEFMYLYNTGKVYGEKDEDVCCPSINSGFFSALAQKQVRAVFVGHDHNNDYGGFLYNVELVYGRKTGFNIYGPPQGVLRGGRLLTIKESLVNGQIQTTFSHKIVQGDGTYQENGEATYRTDKQLKCA